MFKDTHGHLVNHYQSANERKAKYRLARAHGCNCSFAFRYRDWRWTKLATRFGYQSVSDMFLAMGIDPTLFEGSKDDPENPEAWNFDPTLLETCN